MDIFAPLLFYILQNNPSNLSIINPSKNLHLQVTTSKLYCKQRNCKQKKNPCIPYKQTQRIHKYDSIKSGEKIPAARKSQRATDCSTEGVWRGDDPIGSTASGRARPCPASGTGRRLREENVRRSGDCTTVTRWVHKGLRLSGKKSRHHYRLHLCSN